MKRKAVSGGGMGRVGSKESEIKCALVTYQK